jgi:hypothetical protein
MASGRLPFRQAIFPAVICEGKRKMIENKKEKRTLSAQIEKQKNVADSLSTLIFPFSWSIQYSTFSSTAF